ncbi:MAG: hypothetical protein K9G62_08225 [Alphaproteobacteria bacterium]|nr:hypothetical protein [Alphaproteobacteria bacterium]
MALLGFLKSSKKEAPVSEAKPGFNLPAEGILERLPEGVQTELNVRSTAYYAYTTGQRALVNDNQVSGQFCVSVHDRNGARRAIPVHKELDSVSAKFMEQQDKLRTLVAEVTRCEPLPLKVGFTCAAMPRGAESYNDMDQDDTYTPNFPPGVWDGDHNYTDGSFLSSNGMQTVFSAPLVKGGPIVSDLTFDNSETGYKIALLSRLKTRPIEFSQT